ncbi:hypothetical protein M409DRAFT_27565 [Zasmidium cellare ATCC 36951]|uniref:Uncharacterized protein n=1 Tax=Zasmidium cellare ATCC 36951 TaxID=1080233 RepID=A0A6A6C4U3_ZASCE|nr:uncharacterized protein M409DRAFT_27565 [Zasmidium cellare ATCC 36951]KAF2162187.1 hypothetical protein M409DRAFT_27565 [Zasmidium cellare ATCC 36951]
MSYSMSPPAQKPPPFPYQPAGSPPTAQSPYGAPPPKRQRLSPDPRSPQNGTPTYASSPHGFPPYAYGPQSVQSPYSPSSFAGSPQNSFHTPQPYPHQQLPYSPQAQTPQQRPSQISPPPPNSSRDMPPPPRPVKEEKDNVEDIGDMLSGSGINLKEEENYLHGMWNNRFGGGDSFATNQSTSFGSSTMSPNNSFNYLTQGTSFGSSGPDGALAGTLGRPQTREEIEEEAKKKRAEAARKKAERDQHHLNNQFLDCNCVRNRMHARAAENAVRLDVHGVYLRNSELQAQVLTNGEKSDGLVEIKPESKIEAGVPYEAILSFISIAAGERLRGMLDEAYGIARARLYGDHGRVIPPEFADIAEGEGKKSQETVVPESVTGTSWDKTQDSSTVANGEVNGNGGGDTPQPVQTVSFQGTLNARLRELADRDRQAEKERSKKREARKKKAASEGGGDSTPAETPAETPTATAPAEAAAPVKMTKKEMNKKQKEAQTQEVHAFNQSNQTAAMMAMGKKTSRYSWMTGGASQMPTNRFAKPSGGTATPKAQADPASSAVKKEEERVPTWGDWREDSVDGKGIQLRDWAWVLERDGKQKKALQRALTKLK